MVKHKDQRIGVYIDVVNMYHSAKNLYGARVNFQELLASAIADRKLIRAVAYVVKSNSVEEEGFFDALEKQGFELRMKDLQVFAGGAKKGDWDVGLAVDAIKAADKLDVIVLVSGDGDFVPLVTYLQENKGCLVEVIAFGKTTSAKLIESADDYTDLDKDLAKHLLKTGLKRPTRKTSVKPLSRQPSTRFE